MRNDIDLKDKNVFVYAGNHAEALNYLRQTKVPGQYCKIINRCADLYGYNKIIVICIGTYYKRSDYKEITQRLKCMDVTKCYE